MVTRQTLQGNHDYIWKVVHFDWFQPGGNTGKAIMSTNHDTSLINGLFYFKGDTAPRHWYGKRYNHDCNCSP